MRRAKGLSSIKGVATAVICLWVAAGLQLGLSPQIEVMHASPDFLLVAVVCLGLLGDRPGATTVGFIGGAISGSLVGAGLGGYAITRTLAGFLTGSAGSLELDGTTPLAFLATAVMTIFVQFASFVVSPHRAILPFVLATIALAVYNGVIAMPIYALLRRVLDPPGR